MKCFQFVPPVPRGLTAVLLTAALWATGVRGALAGGGRFEKEVAPLLASRCLSCHRAGKSEGGLDLSGAEAMRRSGVVAPGKPTASRLLTAVISPPHGKPRMPKTGEPLTPGEVDRLRQWIAAGAVWPRGVVLTEASRADRSWWSLQPLRRDPPPRPADLPATWKTSPIDRFIYDRLRQRDLTPSPPADRRTLIRRVTYDLTGLAPTPHEVDTFLADSRPDAYERLVDRLLESPAYGEHWGRHWLDVVRFGESRGFERNEIINSLWPFRDYVIDSINHDRPFDQVIREHLAGDVPGPSQPTAEVASAFLVAGPYDDVGNQDPIQAKQIRQNTLDDIVTATSSAFLGMTVNCCRCHDHKFDPIPQSDYYRLQAAFAGVSHGERTLDPADARAARERVDAEVRAERERLAAERRQIETAAEARGKAVVGTPSYPLPMVHPHLTEDRFPPTPARYLRLTAFNSDRNAANPSGFRIDELEIWTAGPAPRNVALASAGAKATARTNMPGDFAEAYAPALAIDGQYGAAFIAQGDGRIEVVLSREETIDRVVFSSDRQKSYEGRGPTNQFVGDYQIEVSRDGKEWSVVANSERRPPLGPAWERERWLRRGLTVEDRSRLAELEAQSAAAGRRAAAVPASRVIWIGNRSQPSEATRLLKGGDPTRIGDEIPPSSLTFLTAEGLPPFSLPGNAPEAERRVRLAEWIVHPSNPLTPRVMANRIWQWHFGTGLVDTPSDFGYLGSRPTHPELLDWLAGRLIHHGWKWKPLHREILLSQTYRQSSSHRPSAAGKDATSRLLWRFPPRRLAAEEIRDTMLQISGKLNPERGGPGFRLYRYLQDNVATYVPLDNPGPETYRRTVYHQNARASRVDVVGDFDCPDNAFPAPTRTLTTTPLQALSLLNSGFAVSMAEALRARLEQDAPGSLQQQVQRLFQLAFGRTPSQAESTAAVTAARESGLRSVCRALLNSNELIYLD